MPLETSATISVDDAADLLSVLGTMGAPSDGSPLLVPVFPSSVGLSGALMAKYTGRTILSLTFLDKTKVATIALLSQQTLDDGSIIYILGEAFIHNTDVGLHESLCTPQHILDEDESVSLRGCR